MNTGFQWDDAAIGAGGALAIVFATASVATIVRRRQMPDPPLPA